MTVSTVLDADFIIKASSIFDVSNKNLLDRLLELPNRKFYCHFQVYSEILNDRIISYLDEKIHSKQITCYKDEHIIACLEKYYGELAFYQYMNFLETACKAFDAKKFADIYSCFDNDDRFDKSTYLSKLKKAELNIGKDNDMGEIKSYVLLQMLYYLDENTCMFGSDDKKARQGIVSVNPGGVFKCVSILSLFELFRLELKWGFETAKPYIDAVINFYGEYNQKTFKVYDYNTNFEKVSMRKVFEDLFAGKFELLANGFLRYKC